MKKIIPIAAIALFFLVSIIIIAAESYQLGKNDGYTKCVKDNYFTITPK